MDTNPNISRLLEMLDNPSAYSEQEIIDCIHSDEETLATYHLMADAKQAYRLKQTQQPADAEAAWQRLESRMKNEESERRKKEESRVARHSARRDALHLENEEGKLPSNPESKPSFSLFTSHFSLSRVAAIFLTAAFLGGLAWAFVPRLRTHHTAEPPQPTKVTTLPLEGERGGGLPVSFSNLPLDSILTVVAAHYNCEVCFRDSAAMGMKFITTWNPEDSLAAFIEHLNMFDGLRLTLQGDTIFVETTNDEEGEQ